MKFFKSYCLKTLQNTLNFCFQNELRYRTGYMCKLKFLEFKKYGVRGRAQSHYEQNSNFVTLKKIIHLDFHINLKRKYREF